MKKLGLVTVLYKSDEVLKGFIKSLSIQTFSNYIVYFIDNSVNDCSTSYLLSLLNEYPTLEYKYLPQLGNIGVAAGNNVGIKATLMDHCDYILLLNNDIETEQNYLLEKIVRKAEEGNADLLVPKILYYDSRRIWMAGGFMDNFRALGVHDGMDSEDSGMFNNEKFITYAPTCFMLISKKVLEKTGFMDEKYFAYYDDTDFVMRALQNGYLMLYIPSLVILHKVSSSAGINSDFYVYYSNRNKIYFIRKHYNGIRKLWLILYCIISRLFSGLSLTKKKGKNSFRELKMVLLYK